MTFFILKTKTKNKMNEDFLQYLWQFGLYKRPLKELRNGDLIEVLHPGDHNIDAGPDFFNTRLRIGSTIIAGNTELHLISSDWTRHNHHQDKAYDNVILHVVIKDDKPACNSLGEMVPTIELIYDKALENKYRKLLSNNHWISCEYDMKKADNFIITQWLSALTIERLESKILRIRQSLIQNKNNWEETLYQQVARSFGGTINSLPFELLAKSLPQHILAKHRDNLLQLEALLFGQSGLLDNSFFADEYTHHLQIEYSFLQKKYNLKPMESHIWKFLRLRPVNFPTIRIAQLAFLAQQSVKLFSKIIESENCQDLYSLFESDTSDYWKEHYVFGKPSRIKGKCMGPEAKSNLIINTVIPFLFAWGKEKDDPNVINRALTFLEQIPAEKNNIIRHWVSLGIPVKSAFDSQALLQLKNNYCAFKNCLQCRIGNAIISQT
jgi:hypothetical protein